VLVDYLISKDVGVHCAQYLLRSVSSFPTFSDAFKLHKKTERYTSYYRLLNVMYISLSQVLTTGVPVLECFY
jgi:hypothetical protein